MATKLVLVKDKALGITLYVASSKAAAEAWVAARKAEDAQLAPAWQTFWDASKEWLRLYHEARQAALLAFEAQYRLDHPVPVEPGPYPLDTSLEYEKVDYAG